MKYSAALAGATACVTITFAAGQAEAACALWDLRGDWNISQRNNIVVHVEDINQDGRNFAGTARWLNRADNSGILNDLGLEGDDPDLWVIGNIEGTIEGVHVEFRAYWDNNTVGVYRGTVAESGRMSGTNWDQDRPDIRVSWFTTRTMPCRMGPLVLVPPSATTSPASPPPSDRPVTGLGRRFPRPQETPPGPDRSAATTAEPGGFANALDRCKPGFVWRESRPSDLVCVTPESRARVAEENRTAFDRGDPRRNYCIPGYVWREAFDGDVVCVYPEIRAMVREENRLGPSRRVGG